MTKKLIIGFLGLLVIAVVMAPSLMAQSLVSGDLTGTVTDPSGAVLSGATVTITSTATGETRTTTTAASGNYRISQLRPGTYQVKVSAPGFSTAETTATVNLGTASVTDVKMAVGSTSQTVEVTSEAPLVNTDNADLSTNFSQNLVNNLPNGGNDLTYVAQTAPGVTMAVGGGYGNFTANGLPGTSNLFTVNGENDMDPYLNLNNSGATNLTLGKNEVQEATVITNAYSGQYGQQAGAQVTYITKSGTNQYHGNAMYYWTGRKMDANDWFNKNAGAPGTPGYTPRPFANNNQWAASFGGPIKKDKNFFFVDYEGIRYIVPSTQIVYAPMQAYAADTLANLAGTPSYGTYAKMFQLYAGAKGYSSGVPFSGNCQDYTGPASNLGPIDPSTGLPIGNCVQKWQGSPALPGTEYILSGRDDQNFSDKDHVFWRVRMDHGTQATSADPINPAFNAASYQPAYDGQSQWNHIFSPNVSNQLIIAGSYYRAIFTQVAAGATFPASVEGDAFNWTTLGNNSFAFPQGRNVTQYQIIDDISWSRGKHSLKFGGNFRRYDISDFVFSEYNIPRVISLSLTDLSMGQADEYIQRFPQGGKLAQPVAIWGLGVYGQDEWKVSKNLKLTFALRAEHNSNPVCQTNCAALPFKTIQNMNTSTSTPYNQIVQPGRHQIYRSLDSLNWAPRFGFSWSPLTESTVIRGGFGMFYDALPGTLGDQAMLNLPQVLSFTLLNGNYFGGPLTLNWADPTATGTPALAASSAAALASGFANGLNYNQLRAQVPGFARPTLRDMAPFHTPAYEEWSFGIDQTLGPKTSFSMQYVGNHGYHIANYNTGLNTHIAGVSNLPTTRTYPSFGTTEQYSTNALSNYNGITAVFNRRMTYGFTIQASYTWAHAIDELSNGGAGLFYNSVSSVTTQINPFCLRCNNYGNADYDARSSFNASYVWQMPFKFSNGIANGVLGGWVLSQNFFARSGLPYTVLDGNSQPSNGVVPPADVIAGNGQQTCSTGNTMCLNPNAFAPAFTSGAYPLQRRNAYRGPMFFDSDFSVMKNIKLTEKLTFGVGANFYNVFNHPNFASPDSNLADSSFGFITATTAPPTGPYGSFFTGSPSGRIIQFQGKIQF